MKRKVFLVCNAHIDPVWQWTWEEGAAETLSTFRTAADFCEAYDGFVFNHNESMLYEWVERYEPALFSRIKRLVAAGKWHIMGGWYLQPDCNMPCGESFVRQIMAGRRYFREKFGVEPTVAANLDSFGHSRGLVQILRRAGYAGYILCRAGDRRSPGVFRWEGYGGNEIMTCALNGHYSSPLGGAADKIRKYMRELPQGEDILLLWGVGDHGGGASRRDLEAIAALAEESRKTDVLVHTTPEAYFDGLNPAALPRYAEELNPCFVGCYTSAVRIKQHHRRLENELLMTEKLHACALSQGRTEKPFRQEFDQAERALMLSEFHDVLPGTLTRAAEEDSLRQMAGGVAALAQVRAECFFALCAGQEKPAEGEIPVMVFNPHPWPVACEIECEYQLADIDWDPERFTSGTAYQDGKPLPSQMRKEDSNILADWRKRIAFSAVLPPAQVSRFDVRMEEGRRGRPSSNDGTIVCECGWGRVEFQKNGTLGRVAAGDRELLKPGAPALRVMRSNEDPWGMLVGNRYDDCLGELRLATREQCRALSGGEALPLRVTDDGPLYLIVEALFVWNENSARVQYRVNKLRPEITVTLTTLWKTPDILLKLCISPAFQAVCAGQTPFGREALPPDGQECVRQKWVLLTGEGGSVGLMGDSGYGFSFDGAVLSASLLHTATYCAHPSQAERIAADDRATPKLDVGERSFRYRLVFGDESLGESIDALALAFNEPPYALSFFPPGGGTRPAPAIQLSDPAVVMTAFKRAADGDGFIIRLQEPTGKTREVALAFDGETYPCRLAPFEVKTLRLVRGAMLETRIDERPL